jgi:heptosyltransferase-2
MVNERAKDNTVGKIGPKLKILIIRPSALGDTLMLLPALAYLRPFTEVILVGRKPGLDLLKPYVHSILDYEGPGWHQLHMERIDPGILLPIPPVDHVIAFLNDPEGGVKENLRTNLPKTTIHIFAPFPPEGEKIHVALYLAQCLQSAGLPIDAQKAIDVACEQALFGKQTGANLNGNIIFHPGSGGRRKNHPPDFWLQLIEQANQHPHFKEGNILLLLGPAEEPYYDFFQENLDWENTQILLSPNGETLTSLLNGALLYIGHDSGITHLAAMHGTPTIALFKNSSIQQWRPIGPAVRVIEDQLNLNDLIFETLTKADELLRERVNTQKSGVRSPESA